MRRQSISLFLFVFLAHAYFVGALDWNQVARIGAILTFIEPGPERFTLRIDEFVHGNERNLHTGDWAMGSDGSLYANKAPGVSLIGVPAYAVIYGLERLAGANPRAAGVTRLNTILLNLWCSVAWTAAATVVLFAFLVAAGFARAEALAGSLAYSFGTLVFPYDTSIWGHATAAACVLVALCLAWWPRGVRRPWLAGLLGGLAILIEYSAVFPFAAVSAALLVRRAAWRERISFATCAALPLLVLLLYQHAVFGDFLTTATSRGNPIFREHGRAFGVLGNVEGSALWGLLFSAWRGLFLYCPILLFAFVGSVQQWRRGGRPLVAACLAAFAATVLFVATFNAWWGGWANGPRYLIVAIPLLAVLAPQLGSLVRWQRGLYFGALALSACNMLALGTVELMMDEAERNPLYGAAYRLLATGQYPHNPDTINLGLWLGLAPRWDLVLFLLLFGAWTLSLVRSTRAADHRS